ncbi:MULTISPECIES: isochorismatase family protein [unclassified Rhizobium]|uniref:isochorismatase family protein n=1 Tax=unclassified Rhizobium TaxID=2613769 RepID=UPI000EAA07DF|nr:MULTISPECIES: isochorismatase family protein [unclassified Rhizobium]AYG70178.1 isochorismatase family protein [Rhizobium sp. CCGE531]AYG76553.1 isochorismatase family protein [Rhizobium sp. CCGE532]
MIPDLQDIQVIFVDLQPALIEGSKTNPPEIIAAAAGALLQASRILQWPVTFSIVPVGGKLGEPIPELRNDAANTNTFSRTTTNPFLVPALAETPATKNRSALIISGFSAETAVLQTAFGALQAGYFVYVPVDAIGSRSERTERAAITEMERRGATLTSVRSLLLRLTPDLSSAPGSEILKALGSL